MSVIRTRLHIAEDGSVTGRVPRGIPPGEHEAEIAVERIPDSENPINDADLRARIRALQEEVSRLPVLDTRTPDEILGYNELGVFDLWL
jgi:hypothetical protein